MFKNNFKLAWRNLIRNKTTSFIHISGLTIGLTGCLLIGLFVSDELKYDDFHSNGDRTYRIFTMRGGADGGSEWASTSPAFGQTLKEVFPEIEKTLCLFQMRGKQLFTNGDIQFLEEKGLFAEPSIFELFHLPLLHGDPGSALRDINSIVLGQAMAKKYFGDENPVGKSILVNNSERKITGVLGTIPTHFHLKFNFLVSFENMIANVSTKRINSWTWQDSYNYIQFHPDTDIDRFATKLTAFVEKNAHPETKENGFYYYPHLQNLEDIYLHSPQFRNDIAVRGSYQYVVSLSIVAIFLLFVACINFVNLTTAKAIRRAKEVGIRKTAGAKRSQLIFQFIGEASIVVTLAVFMAALLTDFLLPALNAFTEKALVFDWYHDPQILSILIGVSFLTALLAGAYPAFVLSGFRPVDALKGSKFNVRSHVQWLRKGLVTLQFTLSIILIISVAIIYQQVNFLGQKEMGFNKEQLLHFPMKKTLYNNFETTKTEFLKIPGVTSASTCFGIPGDIVAGDDIIVPGENRKSLPARIFAIDHEYIETMGMDIIAGRDFSKAMKTDSAEAFIVNETALKTLAIANSPEEAIGKPLEWVGWDKEKTIKKGNVIGVVKDFHYNSLHEEVQTSILHIYPDAYWKMALRLDTKDLNQTIAGIEKTWDSFDTGYPIDYQFVEEGFGAMYKAEQKTQ